MCPQEEREVHLVGLNLIVEDFPERVVAAGSYSTISP